MVIDYDAIGLRIKFARLKAKITQEVLAEKVEMTPAHISNIETGTTRVSLTTMVCLANALSVTMDDLLCDNLVKARVQFERDIAEILADCDPWEIRIVKDMIGTLKASLRSAEKSKHADEE